MGVKASKTTEIMAPTSIQSFTVSAFVDSVQAKSILGYLNLTKGLRHIAIVGKKSALLLKLSGHAVGLVEPLT